MRPHSRRALHQRLDYQRSKVVAISFDHFLSRSQCMFVGLIRIHPAIESVRMGWIDLERRKQHRTYMAMKVLAVSKADRAHRIAVIGFGQREKKFAPSMTGQLPVLSRNPHRDFDRLRTGIRVEHPAQSYRCDRDQLSRQLDRRRTGEPEHRRMSDSRGLLL